ncbi:hypothetical protein D3C87_1354470 [compost metagenome]
MPFVFGCQCPLYNKLVGGIVKYADTEQSPKIHRPWKIRIICRHHQLPVFGSFEHSRKSTRSINGGVGKRKHTQHQYPQLDHFSPDYRTQSAGNSIYPCCDGQDEHTAHHRDAQQGLQRQSSQVKYCTDLYKYIG